MLVIRLQRVGKKHQPYFRIVLQDKRWKPKGKALEILGFYNPRSKEKQMQAERIKFWISKGAQASATMHNMLVDLGALSEPKVQSWKPKKSSQKKSAEKSKKSEATKGQSVPAEKIEATEEKSSEAARDKLIEVGLQSQEVL